MTSNKFSPINLTELAYYLLLEILKEVSLRISHELMRKLLKWAKPSLVEYKNRAIGLVLYSAIKLKLISPLSLLALLVNYMMGKQTEWSLLGEC